MAPHILQHRVPSFAFASALALAAFGINDAHAQTMITTVGGPAQEFVHGSAVAPDGDILVVGALQGSSPLPAGVTSVDLLGSADGEHVGFLARFSPDLSAVRSLTRFAAGTFIPGRVAVDASGIYLAGDALTSISGTDKPTAVIKLNPQGTEILWVKNGAPNVPGGIRTSDGAHTGYTLGVSGLSVDSQGRAHVTGSTSGTGQSGYLVRSMPDGSEWDPWPNRPDPNRTWCIDLNKGAPDLEEALFSRYSGPYAQGECWVSLDRNRRGGQTLVIPYLGGTVIASADTQYTFNCGSGSFPAFDPVLAAFSLDGELRWATNLLENIVSEPDQAPEAMHYDAANQRLYVAFWQHGSNVNRLPGSLVGDTGNMKLAWIGRIDPATGNVEHARYLHAVKQGSNGSWNEDGTVTGWPQNSSTSIQAITTDGEGRVYVLYVGGNRAFTTPDALQDWPVDLWGSHATLLVLDAELNQVLYSTVLRGTDITASGGSSARGLAVNQHGVLVLGHTSNATFIRMNDESAPWKSAYAGQNDLFFARIAPADLPFTPTAPVDPGDPGTGGTTATGGGSSSSGGSSAGGAGTGSAGQGGNALSGAAGDTGTAAVSGDSSGCGCRVPARGGASSPLLLALLLPLLRRLRRRHSA
jgi:hypothetical protein